MEKVQSEPFFIADQEKIYTAGEGITRQFIGYDNSLMMVKVMFEKGAIGYKQRHRIYSFPLITNNLQNYFYQQVTI